MMCSYHETKDNRAEVVCDSLKKDIYRTSIEMKHGCYGFASSSLIVIDVQWLTSKCEWKRMEAELSDF